ncbi:protein of unknown function [Pseudomonas sp. JV241A]|nr:protein of unknown function [Pseudomonas sp. JV241A]
MGACLTEEAGAGLPRDADGAILKAQVQHRTQLDKLPDRFNFTVDGSPHDSTSKPTA